MSWWLPPMRCYDCEHARTKHYDPLTMSPDRVFAVGWGIGYDHGYDAGRRWRD